MVRLGMGSVRRRQKPSAFAPMRIRSIRKRLNVSQPVFAELLYVSKATACKWEQGLRKPSGSALRLLEIAEKQPKVLVEGRINNQPADGWKGRDRLARNRAA